MNPSASPSSLHWLEFSNDTGPQIRLAYFASAKIASFSFDDNGDILVWPADYQDPHKEGLVFLVDGIESMTGRYSAGQRPIAIVFPRRIATDGEKWCPLIQGNPYKYREVPNYNGLILNVYDQILIRGLITKYIDSLQE